MLLPETWWLAIRCNWLTAISILAGRFALAWPLATTSIPTTVRQLPIH